MGRSRLRVEHNQEAAVMTAWTVLGLTLTRHRRVQESFTADSYTQEGLDHIHATNFKSLVLRHYPELKAR